MARFVAVDVDLAADSPALYELENRITGSASRIEKAVSMKIWRALGYESLA